MTPERKKKWDLYREVLLAEATRSGNWIDIANVTTAISNLCMAIKDGFYLPSDDKKVHCLMVELSRRLNNFLKREEFIRSARAELGDFDPLSSDQATESNESEPRQGETHSEK